MPVFLCGVGVGGEGFNSQYKNIVQVDIGLSLYSAYKDY